MCAKHKPDCPDTGPAWIPLNTSPTEEASFEVNHDEVLVDAECELCGVEERLTLTCRDTEQLQDAYDEWMEKRDNEKTPVHEVTFDIVEVEFTNGAPVAWTKLAVYYRGQYEPEYPVDETYVYRP